MSTALTAIGMLGYALSQNALWFFALCLPLGFGAGAIDSGLNNYVAIHYNAAQMSFLHCFYGVGVTCSPFPHVPRPEKRQLARRLQKRLHNPARDHPHPHRRPPALGKSRQTGNLRAANPDDPPAAGEKTGKRHINGITISCLVFVFSCSLEYLCGAWGSTFLVDAKGMAASTAAGITTLYYFGMALGRFLSGVLAAKLNAGK